MIPLTWTSEQARPGRRGHEAVGHRFPVHVEGTCRPLAAVRVKGEARVRGELKEGR